MSLKILTEAGYNFGFGHFYRMSGVCDTISAAGREVSMYIYADEVAKENLKKDYIIFSDWIDPEKIMDTVGEDDTVVVDSYHTDLDILEMINHRAHKLIVIDDNMRLDYKDMIILNPNYFAMFLRYPEDRGNTYYLGKDYTLLREPFNKIGERKVNKTVSDILITMGGTDLKHITLKAVKCIKEMDADVRLHVVVTNAYIDIEQIKEYMGSEDELCRDIDAQKMCDLMTSCDFAIATAGGTSNELIKTQCPSALKVVADNQVLNARYMAEEGYFDIIEDDRAESIIKSFFDFEKRMEMTEKLKTLHSRRSAVDLIMKTAYGESS